MTSPSMSNRMLLLVGLPGSGKSTLSNKIIECLPEWRRVNQDDMKSRKACEKYTREFLNKRYSVIVDRCNFDRDQRKTWVDIAQEYKIPIDCIVMTAGKQECRNRIEERTEHPTGVVGREGVSVLNRFVRNYHPPTPESSEGFSRILYLDPSPNPVCTEERVSEVFELLSACPVLEEERVAHKLPKYKEVVDSEGWTTITRSEPEANKE